MGLSSKQVSVDGLDWEQNLLQSEELELPKTSLATQQQQQQQQPAQQLSCPRCDSTNTKFCYYNNYNRSQPRYFCRSCRRHWTKGGTLRNVPIGGGRKNKRHKTSSSSSSSSKTTTNKNSNSHLRGNSHMGIQPQQQQQQQLSLPFGDQKSFSENLYQSLLSQPSYLPDYISKTSNDDGDNIDMNSSSFLGSTLSLPPIPNCPFASLSSFEHNLPPVHSSFNGGFQSSTLYDYTGKIEPTTSTAKLWQSPNTSSFMDSASCWNWEDPTTFVNSDVRQTWNDDSGQKQEGN